MSLNGQREMCACGLPLHYKSLIAQGIVELCILLKGYYVTVRVGARRWKVPRHYIALHSLKAAELAELGFEELPPEEV